MNRNLKTGRFEPRSFSLAPTKELGYLCGLILGDGWIIKTKSLNYLIGFETTKEEFAALINKAIRDVKLHPYSSTRMKTRKFPNGEIRTDLNYGVNTNSKVLYQALLPYKGTKIKPWKIPAFLSTNESLIGFLQGIYDAEGSAILSTPGGKAWGRSAWIKLSSKFQASLLEVRSLLDNFGIKTCPKIAYSPNSYKLIIARSDCRRKFFTMIGFKLSWKQTCLIKGIR